MAEKIQKLDLQRDSKTYLYFVDLDGNVVKRRKDGRGDSEIIVPNAVGERDFRYLYFIDMDGDLSRTPKTVNRSRARVAR